MSAKSKVLFGMFALILIYIFYGGINFALHKNELSPGSVFGGYSVGGLSKDGLNNLLNEKLKQSHITLYSDNKTVEVIANEAGFYVEPKTVEMVFKMESGSIANFFRPWFMKNEVELKFSTNQEQLADKLKDFNSDNSVAAQNAKFELKDEELSVVEGVDGYGVMTTKIADELEASLAKKLSSQKQEVHIGTIKPSISAGEAEGLKATVNNKIQKSYSIGANGQTVNANLDEKLSWVTLAKKHNTPEVDVNNQKVDEFVARAAQALSLPATAEITTKYTSGRASQITQPGKDGSEPTNQKELSQEIAKKFLVGESYSAEFVMQKVAFSKVSKLVNDTAGSYTYSVEVWGSVSSDLSTFKAQAAETLADSRGWGASFTEVPSGGNFTLVLAEPARVAAASPICDTQWSCRVGRYVIINDDRWAGATTAWNNAGGGLRDYRHMVVNHEVGHWFGNGHKHCGGAGQLAPVMQQQSIDLEGCKFNPWPLPSEL